MSPRPAASSWACVGCGIGVDAVSSHPVDAALAAPGSFCANAPSPNNDADANTTTMTTQAGRALMTVRSMCSLLRWIDRSIFEGTLRLRR
jgi:hypothetical protein